MNKNTRKNFYRKFNLVLMVFVVQLKIQILKLNYVYKEINV